APCMPHFGSSSRRGDTHYEITVGEMACAKGHGPSGTPLNETQLTECVRKSVELAVKGANPDNRKKPPDELEKEIEKQEQLKKEAETKEAKKEAQRKAGQAESELAQRRSVAALTTEAGEKPGDASKPKSREIIQDPEEKAVECIMLYWKTAMDQMRKDCVEEHSTESKVAKKLGIKPPDDQLSKEVEKEKRMLEDRKPPSSKDCLEKQANILKDHMDANGGSL